MSKLEFPYIYHCHTKRCGHAYGEDEELVVLAIQSGVKILCFTDHTPFPFLAQPGIRMNISQLDEYVSSISKLKEKYKDQIEIHIGLECENFPANNGCLWDYLANHGVEFVIIGQHFVSINNRLTGLMDSTFTPNEILDEYVNSVINALESGLTKYVAHPDVIIHYQNRYDDDVEKGLLKIVECAVKNDAYIEFNIHGIINSYHKELCYPYPPFWKKVKEKYPEAKITIGMDVHSSKELSDNIWLAKGLEVAKQLGLDIQDKIDFSKEIKRIN